MLNESIYGIITIVHKGVPLLIKEKNHLFRDDFILRTLSK